VRAFSFLLTLVVFIGVAVVLSITMSRHLQTQLEGLKTRL
jgi:hypothetical protein